MNVFVFFNPHRNPTPLEDDLDIDLPVFPQWSQASPKYLAFRKEGGVIEDNYRLTYNAVMRANSLTTQAPEVTTPQSDSAPGAIVVNLTLVLAGICIALLRQ